MKFLSIFLPNELVGRMTVPCKSKELNIICMYMSPAALVTEYGLDGFSGSVSFRGWFPWIP